MAKTIKLPEPEEMRKRFHDLAREIAAIEGSTEPMRAKRDKFVNESDAKAKAMAAEYLAIEKPLVELKNEHAALARALGFRTGNPEEYAA
jgi:hypothetical protein